MRWWPIGLILCAGAAFAHEGGLEEPGLYAVHVRDGRFERLGDYRNPSVDTIGRRLYADDGAGTIVSWSLDRLDEPPLTFVSTPAEQPRQEFALAAPGGGVVATVRHYPVKFTEGGGYQRVCLDFYQTDGTKLGGPLPLFGVQDTYPPELVGAWHPTEPRLAISVSEGNPKHGLYVFDPMTKNWVLAKEFRFGDETMPELQWQPNGRTLSHIADGLLWLRGGSEYASYRKVPVSVTRQAWVDERTIGLLDPKRGILCRGLDGSDQGTIPGWGGSQSEDSSLPVYSQSGLAWVTPADEEEGLLQVMWLPPDSATRTPVGVTTLHGGEQGYAYLDRGPVWDPRLPILFVTVPPPPAPPEPPAGEAGTTPSPATAR